MGSEMCIRDSYVSEQLEFSDGPYVNEEDDEKEE